MFKKILWSYMRFKFVSIETNHVKKIEEDIL